MALTSRQVVVGNTISLDITITNISGAKIDADSTPSVEIIAPSGGVVRNLSSTNVVRLETGKYRLNYSVPSNGTLGIWEDHWVATVNGLSAESRLYFTVLDPVAEINSSSAEIGDDPVKNWSEAEICGINILMKQLRCRLNDYNLKHERLDEYGNLELVDCPVFTTSELLCFLQNSLSEFNQTPHFTALGFDSPLIYDRNANIIVEGAFLFGVAARMLVEAGREFTLQDNGVSFSPPSLSSVLNNELSVFYSAHVERLKLIKYSMKPSPTGFGSYTLTNAVNPAFARLRHLRARRII